MGIVALDTSAAMIQILKSKVAKRRLDNIDPIAKSIEAALATSPNHLAAPFDLVTCSSVCAFLEDYPSIVRTLSNLLRPGGAFVQWDWEFDQNSEEPFGLTPTQIEEALRAAGLHGILVKVAFDVEFEGEHMRPLLGFGVR
jgi:2-polyprenyl-3-methyl-5-hydroxy-6-metoxy-1,4-benzoquinol methylase